MANIGGALEARGQEVQQPQQQAPQGPPAGQGGDMIAAKMAELNQAIAQALNSGEQVNPDAIAPELQKLGQNLAILASAQGDAQQGPQQGQQ